MKIKFFTLPNIFTKKHHNNIVNKVVVKQILGSANLIIIIYLQFKFINKFKTIK